jgi:hypothetical protein
MSSDDRPWRPGQSADPWLGRRLAHSTAVRRAEGQVYRAAWRAFREWATRCEERVLPRSLRAAGEQQPDAAEVLALAWYWSELLDTDIVTALAWVMDDQYRAVLGDRYAEVLGALPRIPRTPGTQAPAGRSDAPTDADGRAIYVWDRDPYVHEHLATVRNQLVNVPQETFDRITRDLSEGVHGGETIEELAARVHADLTADNCEAWRGRAVTVARTETIRAYNSGTDGAYGQLEREDDVRYERRWLATIDTRTRETHREADGQVAAAGGTFTVGGWPARYPGDPNLPPEESINCRCTVLYEKEPGETDLTNRQYLGAAATVEDTMPRTLSGLIAPYEKPTGDGRRFKAGSLTNRDLPLPLQWQRKTNDGHYDSVTIGRITAIDYSEAGATVPPGGAELFDLESVAPELADDVAHAATLIEQGVVGPSVDLDDFQVEFVKAGTEEAVDFLEMLIGDDDEDEADVEMLVTEGRICAATLVSIPAFAEVKLVFDAEDAVVAAVNSSGWSSMPIADRDAAWDASAAEKGVADKAGVNEDDAPASAWSAYRKAFLWYDPEASDTKAGYKFQIAAYDGDTLKIVPRGVFAAAGVLQGGRGGTSVPQADQDKMKTTLSGIYDRMAKLFDDDSIKAPWDSDGTSGTKSGGSGGGKSAAGRSVTAAGGPVVPPLAWFTRELDGPTPLTVTDEGQVYGHLAVWGTCHVGIGNACVTPPSSHNEYANFHTGSVVTDDGASLAVGKITLGGGHADPRDGYVAAVEHYDDAGSCVAVVQASEDAYGIVVAGALVPGVTEEQVAQLRRSPLSGDWRSIGGNLELVAALAVNVPGFPVPTSRVASGAPVSLVAAGMVPQRAVAPTADRPTPAALADVDTLARAMAKGIRIDRENQARAAKRGELSGVFGKIAAERRVARRAALAETFGRVEE